ncbi:hypothetical protein PHMEG_00027310 [Phytophthora megakarya]|uniref:Uncharacterized protein n=1 Tax=Phytophthora megakarya TaxID=4795 RepID=A0A225V884_9STRA|nr:hypothetical protein PHMEG_00027310 [Phytophthora megakarya]
MSDAADNELRRPQARKHKTGTSTVHVGILIVVDTVRDAAMLVTIMDKFDVHLAFQEGKG